MRYTRARAAAVLAGAFAGIAGIRYPAGAAEFNYKLGLVIPLSLPPAARSAEAAQRILQDSGGRLDIKVFPNNQLGGNDQVLSQVRLGAVELYQIDDGALSSVVPAAGMTGIPFLVSNTKEALNIMSGGFAIYIAGAAAKTGLYRFAHSWESGFRQTENSVRPISTPGDVRGLKIRTSPATVDVSLWKALGATPVTTATSEIYTNLQTHVMDGVTASLSSIEPLKLQEVVKYVSLTNHIWSGYTLLASNDAWQRLPKPLQDIVERNFETARLASNDDFAKADATVNDRLKSLGLAINNVDLQAFRRTVRDAGLYTQWKSLYGAEAWALLEKSVGRTL